MFVVNKTGRIFNLSRLDMIEKHTDPETGRFEILGYSNSQHSPYTMFSFTTQKERDEKFNLLVQCCLNFKDRSLV